MKKILVTFALCVFITIFLMCLVSLVTSFDKKPAPVKINNEKSEKYIDGKLWKKQSYKIEKTTIDGCDYISEEILYKANCK